MAKQRNRKAANGSGSVYQTKSGQWKVAITVQTLDGGSRRLTRNATTQRHGLLILDELRAEHRNLADSPDSVTVTELADKYLISFEGERSSLDGYQILLTHHISPHIVAGVLGHETAESVMKTYAHYITKDSRAASDAIGRLL